MSNLASVGDEDDEVAYQRQSVDFARPVRYAHGPDSQRHPGVPTSRVEIFALDDSHVYPGISRTVRILVPAQYSDAQPAALMVFQDGQLYLDPDLDMRAGIVIDNLVHRGEMPVTIGVFVDPGQPGHRNAEYDAADDTYATFLLTEVLPRVREAYRISDDPQQWAIAGGSSGGNCAFTVAWHRPDRFRRVLTFLASFAQMPGGNPYPELIRAQASKPLRIYMQAATRDLGCDRPEIELVQQQLAGGRRVG